MHGIQGFVAGLIYRKRPDTVGLILALVAGGLIVVGGYFIGEYLVAIWGGPAGAVGEVPFNAVQVLVGSLGGLVYLAVARAYPRIRQED